MFNHRHTVIRLLLTLGVMLSGGCIADTSSSTLASTCFLSENATCTCPKGRGTATLRCLPDGSLYCECGSSAPVMQSDLDMSIDMVLDADPDDMNITQDMCLNDMCSTVADATQDMPAITNCDAILEVAPGTPQGFQATSIDTANSDNDRVGFINGRLCMRAQSGDIWGEEDEFYFVHQTIDDDFDLTINLAQFLSTRDYSKVGVMAREELTGESRMVFVQLSRTKGAAMLGRDTPGEFATMSVPHREPIAPVWLRLIRNKQTFISYTSLDGISWRPHATFEMSNFPSQAYVGIALASNDSNYHATAAIEDISLVSLDPGNPSPCATDETCDEVTTYAHIDEAAEGGLDPTLFEDENILTIPVYQDEGNNEGSLHFALSEASRRADDGQYTIVDVDTNKVPLITIPSYGHRVSNTWIKGNGVKVTSEATPAQSVFIVDQHSIIEGVIFENVKHAILIDTEGGASSRKRSGIWIHHNSFERCDEECIRLSPTRANESRHITIDHNVFGTESSGKMRAIDASNQCASADANCFHAEANLNLSVHHNHYKPSVTSYYLYGGAQSLFYNNWIENAQDTVIDLLREGQVVSRRNIFQAEQGLTMRPEVFGEDTSTGLDTQVEIYEGNIGALNHSSNVSLATYPEYMTYFIVSDTALKSYLTEHSGAPNK